jgi:hypothetical protein
VNVARRWWPISTTDLARASAGMESMLDGWAAEWMAHPPAFSCGNGQTSAGMTGTRAWYSNVAGASVRLDDRAWNRVLRRALDIPAGAALPADGPACDVIEALSRAMSTDLIARLADGLRLPGLTESRTSTASKPGGAVVLHATLGDSEALLRIDANEDWLREAFAPAPSPAGVPSASRRAAVEGSMVTLAAIVGSCEISATDLAGLGVGDVLVSDTRIDQPLCLAIGAGTGSTPFAKASPVRRDGRIAVVVDDTY